MKHGDSAYGGTRLKELKHQKNLGDLRAPLMTSVDVKVLKNRLRYEMNKKVEAFEKQTTAAARAAGACNGRNKSVTDECACAED